MYALESLERPEMYARKHRNRPNFHLLAIFSEFYRTIFLKLCQNVYNIVRDLAYRYVRPRIAKNARNVGPKGRNRADFHFSAIFSEFYQTIFLKLCNDLYNIVFDPTYRYVCT